LRPLRQEKILTKKNHRTCFRAGYKKGTEKRPFCMCIGSKRHASATLFDLRRDQKKGAHWCSLGCRVKRSKGGDFAPFSALRRKKRGSPTFVGRLGIEEESKFLDRIRTPLSLCIGRNTWGRRRVHSIPFGRGFFKRDEKLQESAHSSAIEESICLP